MKQVVDRWDSPLSRLLGLPRWLNHIQAAHLHRESTSLRVAAAQLQISPMAVQLAQKKALAALRQQLVGAG